MPPADALPLSLPPRGLSRVLAAGYIGVSPRTFDHMVKDGTMPRPRRYGARVFWDRVELDEAFASIPRDDEAPEPNPWDAPA